jgi:hypothetical protein
MSHQYLTENFPTLKRLALLRIREQATYVNWLLEAARRKTPSPLAASVSKNSDQKNPRREPGKGSMTCTM